MLSCSFLKKLKPNPFFIQLIFSFIKKKSVYLEKIHHSVDHSVEMTENSYYTIHFQRVLLKQLQCNFFNLVDLL